MALRADHVDLDRDRALVQRYQEGDGAAFDELYRRYHDRVERFCLKRVGNQHAAEELAQEAFTRALAALPAFGGDRHFYAWVTVIASRLCVDHHRRQARTAHVVPLDLPGVPGGQDDIVDAVDDVLVVEAMGRLGPRHQDVLHLREVRGWTYRQIADHYGVPTGTVETLLFRARRALRREFRVIDGAGLAAIPVLGWLINLAARARDRLAPMASMSDAPAALAAAAGATAAAVAMVVIPGAVSPAPSPNLHRPPAVASAGPGAGRASSAPSRIPGPSTPAVANRSRVAGPAAPPVSAPNGPAAAAADSASPASPAPAGLSTTPTTSLPQLTTGDPTPIAAPPLDPSSVLGATTATTVTGLGAQPAAGPGDLGLDTSSVTKGLVPDALGLASDHLQLQSTTTTPAAGGNAPKAASTNLLDLGQPVPAG